MNDTREIVLSRRVACVLHAAVEGRHTSSKELAGTLGVYFKLAMHELGVHSRGEAVVRALDLGLVSGYRVVHDGSEPAGSDTDVAPGAAPDTH